MGRRIRFRGAKATPKTLEKGLLEKSKALAENPHIMMHAQRTAESASSKKRLTKWKLSLTKEIMKRN